MTERPSDTHQDVGHPEGYDYEAGSPHLSHAWIRNWITDTLRQLVREQFDRSGRARVLEIGAGHGAFTDALLATGAAVTVTEMSPPSAELLRERYRHNAAARIVLDETGEAASELGDTFDLVVCASVLHHIPDYLSAIRSWIAITEPGGAFASFQDPLWYPRRSSISMATDRGAYFLWRARRGDVVAGVRTRIRRARGVYDTTNWRDMVEYHVVRNGCDEDAIGDLLRRHFDDVTVTPYWSTQSRSLQRLGDRLGGRSTFAAVARGLRLSSQDGQ